MQLSVNVGSEWLNCVKKKFENKIKIFFKKSLFHSIVIYEKINNKLYYNKKKPQGLVFFYMSNLK
jgi:hypothetical protein